jgi:hypothetical protein
MLNSDELTFVESILKNINNDVRTFLFII